MKLKSTAIAATALLLLTACAATKDAAELESLATTETPSSAAIEETTEVVELSLRDAVSDPSLFLDAELCKMYSESETAFRFIEDDWLGVTPSSGDQTHFFAFVNFDEYLPPETPDEWMEEFTTHLDEFVKANSHGNLNLTLEHNSQWLSIGTSASELRYLNEPGTYELHKDAIVTALEALDDQVDFSPFDGVHVIFGVKPFSNHHGTAAFHAGRGDELVYDGKKFHAASTVSTDVIEGWGDNSPQVVTHEFLHTFGLPDLYAYETSTEEYSEVFRYVGQVDLMGMISSEAPSLFAWSRWRLDWIANDSVYCLEQGSEEELLLNSLGSKSGPRLLVLGQEGNERLAVEYRPSDLDNLGFGGLIAYRITEGDSGKGAIVVPGVSDDPFSWTSANYIQDGEIRCFDQGCVELIQSNSIGAVVKVSAPRD